MTVNPWWIYLHTRRSSYRSNENGKHRRIRTAPRERESNRIGWYVNRQFTTKNLVLFSATTKKKKNRDRYGVGREEISDLTSGREVLGGGVQDE